MGSGRHYCEREDQRAERAAALIQRICNERGVDPNGLVLHSDNGKPMRANTMIATLQWMGTVPLRRPRQRRRVGGARGGHAGRARAPLSVPEMVTVAYMLSGVLSAVDAADLGVHVIVAVVVTAVTIAAFYIPTRRAVRLDPVRALQQEWARSRQRSPILDKHRASGT